MWPRAVTQPPKQTQSGPGGETRQVGPLLHKRYDCSFCGLALHSHADFNRHLLAAHQEEKRFLCLLPPCDGAVFFDDAPGLVEHRRTAHEGELIFTCSAVGKRCRKRFADIDKLLLHHR